MSARELPKIASGTSNHPKHFAVERNLEDPPWKRAFSNKKDLIGSRRNADGIRLPNDRGQARAGGGGAIDGAGFRIRRHVDGKHAQELALRIEHLNAPIRAIADIQIVAAVGHNGMRQVKLPRPCAWFAPRFHPVAILVILGHTGVDVSVGDVDVPLGIPGYVGGLAK